MDSYLVDDHGPALRARSQRAAQLQLESVEQMLGFAVSNGIVLPEPLLKAIFQGHAAIAAGIVDQTVMVEFTSAAAKLSQTLYPATSEGIRYTSNCGETNSPATRLARNYSVTAIVTFVILLVFQAYWVLLTDSLVSLQTTQDELVNYSIVMDDLNDGLVAKLGRQPTDEEERTNVTAFFLGEEDKQKDEVLRSAVDAVPAPKPGTTSVKPYLTNSRFSYLTHYQAIILDYIKGFVPQRSFFGKGEVDEPHWYYLFNVKAGDIRTLESAHITIEFMNKYLLPILYGLLGASIYIVRRLATDIRAGALTERARTDFRIRFFLGGVSGLAVSWFFLPGADHQLHLTASLGSLANLSPLVVSFLAGYGVEIVFATIDRIISGFRDGGAAQRRLP